MDGARLRAAEKPLFDSADAFGVVLDVSGATASRWKKNVHEPDDDMKRRIADTLGVSVAYLNGESNEKKITVTHSETDEMLKKIIRRLAIEDPDIVLHFRDMSNNLDQMTPNQIRALAAGFCLLAGETNKELEGVLLDENPGGEI